MILNSKKLLGMLECDTPICKILEQTPDTYVLSIDKTVQARSKYSRHKKTQTLYSVDINFTPPYPLPINTPEDLSISKLLELTYNPYKHNQHTIPMMMAAISYYLDKNNQTSTITNIEDILTITNTVDAEKEDVFEQSTKFYISSQAIELLQYTSNPSTSLMKTLRKILLTLQLKQHLNISQNPNQTEPQHNPLNQNFSAHMFYKDIIHASTLKRLEPKTHNRNTARRVTLAIKDHQQEAEVKLQQTIEKNRSKLYDNFQSQIRNLKRKSITIEDISEICNHDALMANLESIILPTLTIDIKGMAAHNALSATLQHVRSNVTENTILHKASSYFRKIPPHKQSTPDSSLLSATSTTKRPNQNANQPSVMKRIVSFFKNIWSAIVKAISKQSETKNQQHIKPTNATANAKTPMDAPDQIPQTEINSKLQQTTSNPGAGISTPKRKK